MALLPPVRIHERGSDRANGYRDYVPQWVERDEEGSSGRMEEDTELEEGEAFEGDASGSASGDDDLERLSYLDTRLESVLGDCQKEFQGNLSTERLGSKYGGYGSFLPSTIRAAPVLGAGPALPSGSEPTRPRPPEGHVGALRPRPTEGFMERARRGQGSAAVAAATDPNSASKEREPVKKKTLKSINAMVNASAQGATNFSKETGPVEKKGLTVRLQLPPRTGQGVDRQAQNSVYNKFGLDHPSSPSEDDLEDDDRSCSDDNASPDLSPPGMIRAMTAFEHPQGGMISPGIPALVASEPSERKEMSKQMMYTLASKTDGIQSSRKVGALETLNKVGKETKTKRKEVVAQVEPVKVAPVADPLKSSKKEGKEGSLNTLKVSYKHSGKEDPLAQSKTTPEPKKKAKESSKEYSAQKEPNQKVRDAKDDVKDVKKEVDKKELVPKVPAEIAREGPKESFKVTMKDLPPPKDHVKPGQRDNLDYLKDVVKAGKKVNKKAGKETTRSQSKDSDRDKGVHKDPGPVVGDVNGLHARPPQALCPPAVGTSNGEVAGPVSAPVQVVSDDWVECVKCGKWRLAIPGINVNSLPEEWQCREMTWLPEFNSCKFSEEITTAAVYSYLGLQKPNTLPAAGLPQAPALPTPLPPLDPALENRHLEPKPTKGHKPSSKKGVAKKLGGTTVKIPTPTVKKVDMGSVKNKNLSDVVQAPERGLPPPSEDPGYQRVMADKQKFKENEKLKRMRVNEGEDTRPQKQAVREDERNKVPGGVKRKKKTELSQDQDETQVVKKAKGADSVGRKTGVDMFVQSKGQSSDENTHSLHYGSDDAGISSRNAGRSSLPAQAPKKVRVTLSGSKEPKKKDGLDAKGDDRKRKEMQRAANLRCKPEYLNKHESSDSDEDKQRRDEYRKSFGVNENSRRVDTRGRNGYLDGKKRVKDEGESEYHNEKRRMLSKDLDSTRDSETGFSPRSQPDCLDDERRPDGDFRNKRLFDEVSGIARTYVQGSLGERADDSPHGQSPAPNLDGYSQDQPQDEKRGRRSRSHSPSTASSSEPSFARRSSASGSKGPSPIESTVSSSPLRSLKTETRARARRVTECVQANDNTTTGDSHPTSDKQSPVSPSPKRSAYEHDTQSDPDGQPRQVHHGWDDRCHSLEADQDVRGIGRDVSNNRDTSGRHRYARSNSREVHGDCHKYDGKSRGSYRDDDLHLEEGGSRERRAGSASQIGNGDGGGSYERYREERHRERDDRYERRGEDRFRDRDRERERPREIGMSDRGGDIREERSTKERSVHQRDDWSGRPSSRESRLDKQGGMNWREDSRPGRDTSREGGERAEDGREKAEDGVANKVNVDRRSKHMDDSTKAEPCHDEHEPVQCVQRDSSSHRYDNNQPIPQKDSKWRINPVSDRNGERSGAGSSARKEVEGAAFRSSTEPPNGGNSRSRPEGQLPSLRKRGSSPVTETGHVDESAKHGKEPKDGSEGSYPVPTGAEVGHALNPGHIATGSDGGSDSPTKKTNHAFLSTFLIKEAKSLKHSADRLKNRMGMEDASRNMYLQAGLKFLEGAHHQEASNERPGDSSVIFRIYLDTANLCDYCSSAFEKNKDHAAAALSYMVAAVARMRVLMLKSKDISKDCVDLQHAVKSSTALGSQVATVQTPPTRLASVPQPNRAFDKPGSSQPFAPIIGESPSSSSASDVDNLNNHAALSEKLGSNTLKGVALSPLPGSSAGTVEVLPSRLYSNYQRLLTNSGDVHRMLESWNKARVATAAYEAECAGDDTRLESILAIRRVGEIGLLDDMDALVKQVRVALHAIGH